MSIKKDDYSINAIEVLTDNIIWVWVIGRKAVVVDPAVAEPVSAWLQNNKLSLEAILQTHHHNDHIGGTLELIKEWPKADVIAAKADIERIPFQNISVTGGDILQIMGQTIEVLSVDGHTKNHLAYYLHNGELEGINPAVFCGDTLFGGGCGRLFEGTAKDMFKALKTLNSLPSNTEIYCAHEYTESNLRWANQIDPNNLAIKTRLESVINKRKNNFLSLPSSIEEERLTNLFLKAKSHEELSALRSNKDNWKQK